MVTACLIPAGLILWFLAGVALAQAAEADRSPGDRAGAFAVGAVSFLLAVLQAVAVVGVNR